MRIILFTLLITVLIACNKEEERILLVTTHFELNECFSTMSLNESEVIISNQLAYKEFQDSIRRHFFSYCDTVFLPEINFGESIFLGKYTQNSGCETEYNRSVFYNENTNSYDYEIKVIQVGLCEKLNVSFNCAVVPKQSENNQVNFTVIYSYKDE